MKFDPHIATAVVAGLWLVLTCMIRFLPIFRRALAVWVMVGLGVPVLGWVTLVWGPLAGVSALAIGLAVLLFSLRDRAGAKYQADPPSLHMHGGAE